MKDYSMPAVGKWKYDVDDARLHEGTAQTANLLRTLHHALDGVRESEAIDKVMQPRIKSPNIAEPETAEVAAFADPEVRSALEALDQRVGQIDRDHGGRSEAFGRLRLFDGRAPIWRGFVNRYRDRPIIQTRSAVVLQLIVALPKFDAKLKRENHAHFGIHYHYLDSDERRSDTVLCFKPVANYPLYSEAHAVNGAAFIARPENWREKKRKSVYELLEPELSRFSGNEFRPPSANAAIVWRKNASTMAEL